MTIRNVACLTAAAALTASYRLPGRRSVVGEGRDAHLRRLRRHRHDHIAEADDDVPFSPADGAPPDKYIGRIDQFGLALGAVNQGTLVWGVIAPTSGVPRGALAGSYGGVGAQATAGAGVGANVLVGGTGRSFSLQPLSIQGQTGINFAAGVTTVTLTHVQ